MVGLLANCRVQVKAGLSFIDRRSNMLLADMGGKPYGKSLNFLQFSWLPTAPWPTHLATTPCQPKVAGPCTRT